MSVAKDGDVLVLTKPLGTGIGVAAIDLKVATPQFARTIADYMTQFHTTLFEACKRHRTAVHAVVAVNARGLLGHTLELCRRGNVRAEIRLEQVPLISGIAGLAEQRVIPDAAHDNLKDCERFVRFDQSIPESARLVLSDPQFNGGLLLSIAPRAVDRWMRVLARQRRDGWIIGAIHRGRPRVDVS